MMRGALLLVLLAEVAHGLVSTSLRRPRLQLSESSSSPSSRTAGRQLLRRQSVVAVEAEAEVAETATIASHSVVVPRTPSLVAPAPVRIGSGLCIPALHVLWRFTRPHTFIGSGLCIPALHVFAAQSLASVLTRRWWLAVLTATAPALLVNVFITGLNQLCDVEIDRVNKPELPVASGELAWSTGAAVCGASLTAAVAMGQLLPMSTNALRVALYGSAVLGAAYSAPPIRLKRSPTLAAFAIIAVRGAIINACFFLHATTAAFAPGLARSYAEAHVNWVVAFFGLFGVAIALMKDVPDVKGDAQNSITTLSTSLGQQRVFDMAASLEAATLGAAGCFFTLATFAARQPTVIASRALVGLSLLWLTRDAKKSAEKVNARSQTQVKTAYMRLWKHFYACYILLPFAR